MTSHELPRHRHDSFRRRSGGYTIVEILAVTTAVFAISGLALVATLRISEGSRITKLQSDVATINSAVTLYLASGGSLDHVVKPEDVLDALKTTRSATEAKAFAGAPSSSMIDRRITAQMLDSKEAEEEGLRALWDRDKQRFVLAEKGTNAVKEFWINEKWSERDIAVEKRSRSALAFSAGSKNTWIWDAGKWDTKRGNLAPTLVTTNPTATPETSGINPGAGLPGGSGGVVEEKDTGGTPPPIKDPPPPPRLATPNFDPAPGSYPIEKFPLLISLTNLPDPKYGDVYYKLSGSKKWIPYAGKPISVKSGQQLDAQALSKDLKAYLDSSTRSGKYVSIIPSLTGTIEAAWAQPTGGPNLLSEISNSKQSAEFLHGNTQLDLGGEIFDAGVQNRMNFVPSNIAAVAPSTQFEIGTLTMLNGTTFNDSEASTVALDVKLNVAELGGEQKFTIPFSMVNTENSDDRVASADIIELGSLSTSVRPTVNGVRYDLTLSIGIVDKNGVTSGSKFLVYEGATATGKIYGKFVPKY